MAAAAARRVYSEITLEACSQPRAEAATAALGGFQVADDGTSEQLLLRCWLLLPDAKVAAATAEAMLGACHALVAGTLLG